MANPNQQVANQQPQLTPMQSLSKFINSDNIKNKFAEVLGEKGGASFVTSLLTVVTQNKTLQNADKNSIYTAALIAASLQLPINPNLGFAYILPYKTKIDGQYVDVAQFQLGAKGFKQLAQRSGQYVIINDDDVREGEILNYDRLTGKIEFNWVQNQEQRSKLKIIGYVSYFELLNGFTSTFYMSVEEITAHGKKYSQTFKKGFGLWVDDFRAMALKTVTKLNISKNGPLSIELQRAMVSDQSVIKSDSFIDNPETLDIEPEYVDNNETPEEKAEDKKAAVKAAKDAAAKVEEQPVTVSETSTNEEEKDMYVRISECKTQEELTALSKEMPSDDFDLAIAVDTKKRELASNPNGQLFDSKGMA